MVTLDSAGIRYINDEDFRNKVHKVVQIMEADKPTALTQEEIAIISLSASVALAVHEEATNG